MAVEESRVELTSSKVVAATWVFGLVLLFVVTPIIRRMIPLSDELDAGAIVMPVWTFLQLAVVTAILRLTTRRAAEWSRADRGWFALGIAALGLLLGPSALSLGYTTFGPGISSLSRDPMQVQLLWSVPAALYVPAVTVLSVPWVREPRGSASARLAQATLALGVMTVAELFWFTYLWARYVNR